MRILVPPLLLAGAIGLPASNYFKIAVVDEATGRGVPLVELSTRNSLAFWTDSNGIIAFDEPGLMDQRVKFTVSSHGYELPGAPDGSWAADVKRGSSATLKLRRVNIAERLYRITGEGIYRDSVLTGEPVPIRKPLLNARVVGQDTVTTALYKGKIYWVWGDTNGPAEFSLACSGATSELPASGGLDPSRGVDLSYFAGPSGFSKSVCNVPGPGMKWNFWMAALKDEKGIERLALRYRSMKDLGKPIESALLIWNDTKETFERLAVFDEDFDRQIPIHPFRATDGRQDYLYLPDPYPSVRIPASLKAVTDPRQWEVFTCLMAGTRYSKTGARLHRSADGRLIYAWKRNTDPVGFDRQHELIAAGRMKAEEGWYQLRDVVTDAPVKPHAGSVFWNDYRRRWVLIVEENRGSEDNGEIWFAEADTPAGPWVYARKVVTHNKYTFYNPAQHPFFDQEGGRLIYFEGTYSDTFSGAPRKTPHYNYNQIMYRLALDDPRLELPVPVYRTRGGRYLLRAEVDAAGLWDQIAELPFFALPAGPRVPGAVVVAGFAGLAPGARAGVAGQWKCRAKEEADQEWTTFLLRLEQEGATVHGNSEWFRVLDGTYVSDALVLRLEDNDGKYVLSGSPRQGKLAGRWKAESSKEAGPFECSEIELLPRTSPAVVPLYAYAGPAYTLEPRSGSDRPVALVWRNPMSGLILDRGIVPVRQ
ncbi:MAG: hypothetical protein HYZ57_17700 [Acidobacteria bacterium]|nr:hypothetical protein [Acidobacteriota bacterium]